MGKSVHKCVWDSCDQYNLSAIVSEGCYDCNAVFCPAAYPLEIDEKEYFSYIKLAKAFQLLQALVNFLESRTGHEWEAMLPSTSPFKIALFC